MRIGESIYNLDGQPFRSVDVAERMLTLLAHESGHRYRLETCPGGYCVEREEVSNSPAGSPTNFLREEQVDTGQDTVNVSSKEYELRPAIFRTNPLALILMAVAMVLVLMPDQIVASVLAAFNSRSDRIGSWWLRSQSVLSIAGGIVLIVVWFSLLWQRANALYRVTGFGVEARLGIIANQTIGLRYQDIRSMTVKQSLIDRLLGVGLLEFTSAGSDGMPVQFRQIANPGKVLSVVKDRMQQLASND